MWLEIKTNKQTYFSRLLKLSFSLSPLGQRPNDNAKQLRLTGNAVVLTFIFFIFFKFLLSLFSPFYYIIPSHHDEQYEVENKLVFLHIVKIFAATLQRVSQNTRARLDVKLKQRNSWREIKILEFHFCIQSKNRFSRLVRAMSSYERIIDQFQSTGKFKRRRNLLISIDWKSSILLARHSWTMKFCFFLCLIALLFSVRDNKALPPTTICC